MFDAITSDRLRYYVYALVNPITGKVFYIGTGIGNRVFDHLNEFLENPYQINSFKKEEIREVLAKKKSLEHVIIRHGLNEKEAYLLESTLIDYHNHFKDELTNAVSGHESGFYGIKSADELVRQYNASPLKKLEHEVIIININKRYADTKLNLSIYEATKQAWVLNEKRLSTLQYALAEFQGIIVGVFKIREWYKVKTDNNKRNNRWGFNGVEAEDTIKALYFNKSIAHIKKKGAANPIRYNL